MSTTPRVSVVICFLNAEPFIAETIQSVLAQTMTDFELLLVDDGSTDGSTSIALDFAKMDPRIRYLEHTGHRNIGLSASRNVGINAARASYVATLDADDVWMPEKLAEQCAILDENPEVALVCGATIYWSSWDGGTDRTIPSGHRFDIPIAPPEAMLAVYPLGLAGAPCPSDFLMRREAVLSVNGFEASAPLLYEDQAFLCKIYLEHYVLFSSRVWLKYRLHSNSIMAKMGSGERYHQARLWFLEYLEGYLSRHENVPKQVGRALKRALERYRSPVRYSVRAISRRFVLAVRRRLGRLAH